MAHRPVLGEEGGFFSQQEGALSREELLPGVIAAEGSGKLGQIVFFLKNKLFFFYLLSVQSRHKWVKVTLR